MEKNNDARRWNQQCRCPQCSRLAVPCGRADLRHHGAADGCRWRLCRYALFSRATGVTAERNGADVLSDECLPFGTVAEAGCSVAKRRTPIMMGAAPLSEPFVDHLFALGPERLGVFGIERVAADAAANVERIATLND